MINEILKEYYEISFDGINMLNIIIWKYIFYQIIKKAHGYIRIIEDKIEHTDNKPYTITFYLYCKNTLELNCGIVKIYYL